jgi:hypothetical protein
MWTSKSAKAAFSDDWKATLRGGFFVSGGNASGLWQLFLIGKQYGLDCLNRELTGALLQSSV